MDNENGEPKNKNSCKHLTLGCINFSSYPSEYTFNTPRPLKVTHWPQYVPKPLQRRNRPRHSYPYSRYNTPVFLNPVMSSPVKHQRGNANKRFDREADMKSNDTIVNLNSVTESQIDNMSFVEYAAYISNVLSVGEKIAIKNLPNSNYKILKDSCCEICFEDENPLCPTSQIYFQGIPWATKDFTSALKRLTNTWLVLKNYMELQQSVYNARISPTFQNHFTECQTTNKRVMFHLLKTVFKLDRVNAFQSVSATANNTPHSKSFHTIPNAVFEFYDDSKESKINYSMKTDLYFGLYQNKDIRSIEYFYHQEEVEEADAVLTLNKNETHSLTKFVNNQQKVERFANFPQSDLKYSEADSCFDLNQNEAHNLTFVDQQENETTFSLLSNSKLKNSDAEEENRFFTFSPKESTDIKKWSVELLTKTKEISNCALPESETSKQNTKKLPKTKNELKNNSFVVTPTTDFSIQMKNYRYPVEFTHKVKNIHLNVKKLLSEDKITKINVSSIFERETKEKQEKIRLNCGNFFDHKTL